MTDRIVALSRFRADVARALTRRGKGLLESPKLADEVAALEPLEAYFIVKELGVDEALPILQHATREQVQAFVDLDCWQGDEPSIEDLDAWLAPFAAAGAEALAQAFRGLDEQLQTVFLARSLVIYDTRSGVVPEPLPDARRMTTPDSFFVVEPTPGEREVDPFFLVESLYRASLEEAFALLMAAKWELTSDLEEQARRFREGRLEDLGFPSRAEAAKLFTPPPAKPRPPAPRASEPATLPALYAAPLAEGSLLARALARVRDPGLLTRIEHDLVCVVNAAIIGYGESPRDLAHAAEIAARVRDTVSLGLELEGAGEGEALENSAAELFERWAMADLFRRGHAAVLPLAESARALAADPVVKAWLDKPEEGDDYSEARRDRAFVLALVRKPPLFAGFDPLAPAKARAFASNAEIEEALGRLDAIAARVR